jgi:HEAT repeat protein
MTALMSVIYSRSVRLSVLSAVLLAAVSGATRAATALESMPSRAARLTRQLSSKDVATQAAAARELGRMNPPPSAAVPALVKVARGFKRESSQAAFDALVSMSRRDQAALLAMPCFFGHYLTSYRTATEKALSKMGVGAIPAWSRSVFHPKTEFRSKALKAISAMGPRAVPRLQELLGHWLPEVSAGAATALGNIGRRAEPALPALTRIVHDKGKPGLLRARCAEALAGIAPASPQVRRTLIAALADARAETREGAAKGLRRLGSEASPAVPQLTAALGDRVDEVRMAAARALSAIGPRGKSAGPALLKCLKHANQDVRSAAAVALGYVRADSAQVVPALLRLLQRDKIEGVRQSAAAGLGRLGAGGKSAVPGLLRILKRDGNRWVRSSVARALGRIGPAAADAVPQLTRTAKDDKDSHPRESAVEALGRIGPAAKSAVADLVKHARSYRYKQAKAAVALFRIGAEQERAREALVSLLSHKKKWSRFAALNVLRDCPPATQAVLPELLLVLGDAEPEVGKRAVKLIAGLGPAAIAPLVETLQGKGRAAARYNAAATLAAIGKPALPAIEKILAGKDVGVRCNLIQALGKAESVVEEAVPLLVGLLGDRERMIRTAAGRALGSMGRPGLLALRKARKSADFRTSASAVTGLGEAALARENLIPEIIAALDLRNPMSASAASNALGHIGYPALPYLRKALRHKDPRIRKQVARTILQIGPLQERPR